MNLCLKDSFQSSVNSITGKWNARSYVFSRPFHFVFPPCVRWVYACWKHTHFCHCDASTDWHMLTLRASINFDTAESCLSLFPATGSFPPPSPLPVLCHLISLLSAFPSFLSSFPPFYIFTPSLILLYFPSLCSPTLHFPPHPFVPSFLFSSSVSSFPLPFPTSLPFFFFLSFSLLLHPDTNRSRSDTTCRWST